MRTEMMRDTAHRATAVALAVVLSILVAGCGDPEKRAGGEPAAPAGNAGGNGGVEVTNCDGGQAVVPAGAEGQVLADALLDQWKRDHPERNWVEEEKEKHELKPPADNSGLLAGDRTVGHTYGQVTERDLLIWARETEKMVVDGSRIFHGAKLVGSSVGVSCDMCHPHAANTHPETYPKFQTQLGRVALLRDMINWCIENPARGTPLAADDPKMRALEAYILAQRSGTALEYGKH